MIWDTLLPALCHSFHGGSFGNWKKHLRLFHAAMLKHMFIWSNIDGKRSAEELAALMKAAIVDDVDDQKLYEDISEFIDTLIARQFVEV